MRTNRVLLYAVVIPAGVLSACATYWALAGGSWQTAAVGTALGLVLGTTVVACADWLLTRLRS